MSKWRIPGHSAPPYGEEVTLEVFIDPLAAFLAGNKETDGFRLIRDPVDDPRRSSDPDCRIWMTIRLA